MAFNDFFLNFNFNFSPISFNFSYGQFSMPNFLSRMPIFSFLSTFSPVQHYQSYPSTALLDSCSLFKYPTSYPTQELYNNYGFNCYDFNNPINYSWQNNYYGAGFDVFNYTKNSTSTNYRHSTSKQLKLCQLAKSYEGKVNSDAEGNRLFSPNGAKQAWCADFVSYVTKKTYGNSLPKNFGFSSVSGLRDWAKNPKNDCYIEMPNVDKASFIAQNIKPGDIMIEKDGGKSHTGIVTKVNRDGSFETVEGNVGVQGKVETRKYEPSSSTLSGFISLSKFA